MNPVILFFLDQLRADALGASGNAYARTPHLDGLAREAVRFETCVTNAPLCRPARFTLMTGQPVHVHGVSSNGRPPSARGRPSHVRRMRDEAGYHTAVIGKTHLHAGQGHFDQHRGKLRAWGFEEALELPDAQQHWVESAHSDWLGEEKYLRWRDYIARYHWEALPPDTAPWKLGDEDHLDSFCARTAADWLRRYTRDAPPYLQINFPGPHPPFDAPSAWQALFDPRDPSMPAPILGESRGPISPAWASYARHQRVPPQDWTLDRALSLRARYHAKVALLDRCVGQVLEALRETRLYDSAWIVLTADHGEMLADHRLTGKVLVYEQSIRVPLLIRPPGGTTGWTSRGAVDLLDVVATILELGGLAPDGMGGISLRDRVLQGPDGPHAHRGKTVLFETLGYAGLRTDELTLSWQLDTGRPVELYDRRADPEQRFNRVDEDPRLAELVDELSSRRSQGGPAF